MVLPVIPESERVFLPNNPEDPTSDGTTHAAAGGILERIYDTIVERKAVRQPESYVTKLLDGGVDRILKKIAEEAGEVILAAKNDKREEIIYEVADLLFHTLLVLGYHDITVGEVYQEARPPLWEIRIEDHYSGKGGEVSTGIFCRIVDGTIPAKIAFQDDRVLAFHDVNPQAPVHVLVIPKRHVQSLQDITRDDGDLLGHLLMVCKEVGSGQGLGESGYRVVTNVGPDAGQSVFHLHLHLLGGRHMAWPPG